jgi:PAS domain S-box-containing protein
VGEPFGFPLVDGASTEVDLRPADSRPLIAEMRVSQTMWEQEAAYLISLRDITQRKQQEKALEVSEARFRSYIDSAPHGVFIADAEGRYQDVNPAACQMSGYSEEELLSMRIVDLVASEERDAAAAALDQLLTTGQVTSSLSCVRKDGTRVFWRVDAVKLADNQILGFARDETQRKQAEERLQRSAELNEMLLNSLPHPALLIRRDGIVLAANQSARELGVEVGVYCWIGFNKHVEGAFLPEELRRYATADACDVDLAGAPEGVQCSFCKVEDAFEAGEPFRVPELKAFDRLWDMNWVPVDDDLCLCYAFDITERKALEDTLRASEQRLEKILQTMIDGMVVVNLDGEITYANPAAERILEIREDEIMGRYYHERSWSQIDEDGEPYPQEKLPLALALGEQREVEDLQHGILAPSGQVKWLSVNAAPLVDETGAVYGAIASFRDISDRKAMEKALQNSEQRYRTVFDYAGDAIFVHDLEGRFLDVNRVACERLGYSREEFLTMTPVEITRGTESEGMNARIRELVEVGHIVFEAEHVARDGTSVPVEISSRHIEYDGKPAILSIARDITERKEAENRIARYAGALEQSNQDLERFAYVISHDLQEPLRMVSGYLDLLARRYEAQLDEKADMYIHYAVDGARRMQEMIKALLDLSRVETRGEAFAPTDCTVVLERTLTSLRRAIEDSGAEVTYDPLPTVMADGAQLGQVFQNLIANALKFRRADVRPRIHIAAEPRHGEWVFTITDNGIGIPASQLDRIFQIFQRLHTRESYPGVGIGLALCRRIVERHGGRIWAESEVGAGSTFYFSVPHRKRESST